MQKSVVETSNETLLVFNCHEAWVHQLGLLGLKLDIIVGLKGQFKRFWDHQMRPLPLNSRLIGLREALGSSSRYYCIIAHNIGDLLEIKTRPEPPRRAVSLTSSRVLSSACTAIRHAALPPTGG